jgi:sugar lactone lactonase YvrE
VVAASGNILTIAGNGNYGYNGDGGAATSAELNNPLGVELDATGNLFIADTGNNVIREVVSATGKIQSVAGNGTAGYSGDGASATSAELNTPNGVAVDASGNLFIADYANYVIREVVAATGKIQTSAGNGTYGYGGDGSPATTAELQSPNGVAVDASGNLFIADTANNVIREVVAATGKIQTVAGTGVGGGSGDGGPATSAELNSPVSITLDAGGNLFIADSNDVIREVVAATGNIQTIAGTGNYGYSGDGGPATNAELNGPVGIAVDSGGNLFFADFNNHVIREVVAATGNIQTVVGNGTSGYSGDGGAATTAELSGPDSIAVDASGNLFIADFNNNVVREVVAATGKIQTVAGSGTSGYSGDGGAATSAKLSTPAGVALDESGNLFIVDYNNSVIREVMAASGKIETVAGNGTSGYSGDGGAATSAALQSPNAVALDSGGNLYIADRANNVIREVYR